MRRTGNRRRVGQALLPVTPQLVLGTRTDPEPRKSGASAALPLPAPTAPRLHVKAEGCRGALISSTYPNPPRKLCWGWARCTSSSVRRREPETRAKRLGAQNLPLEQLLNIGPGWRAPAKGMRGGAGGLLPPQASRCPCWQRGTLPGISSSLAGAGTEPPLGGRAGEGAQRWHAALVAHGGGL